MFPDTNTEKREKTETLGKEKDLRRTNKNLRNEK